MTLSFPRNRDPSFKNIVLGYDFQGYSLIEFITGLTIVSVVLMVIINMVFQIQTQFMNLSEKVKQETEAEEMSIALRHYLTQAIELSLINSFADFSATPVSNANGNGRIISYDLDASWTLANAGQANPVALFYMESQPSNMPAQNVTERFRPVGIFVQRPSLQKYGLVAVKVGSSGDVTINGANPFYRFTNIVDFKIKNILFEVYQPNGRRKIKSFSLSFTKRFFKTFDAAKMKWCPPMQTIPECAAIEAPYIDIVRTIEITVRNNVLGPSFDQKRFTAQGLGWFDGIPRRFYDGIYFFRTNYPSEALKR